MELTRDLSVLVGKWFSNVDSLVCDEIKKSIYISSLSSYISSECANVSANDSSHLRRYCQSLSQRVSMHPSRSTSLSICHGTRKSSCRWSFFPMDHSRSGRQKK